MQKVNERKELSDLREINEQNLSQNINDNLKEFSKRELGILENPLAESGREALKIVDELGDFSKKEQTFYKLGQMFGLSQDKIIGMVKKDRGEKRFNEIVNQLRVEEELEKFGLGNQQADDYNYANVA